MSREALSTTLKAVGTALQVGGLMIAAWQIRRTRAEHDPQGGIVNAVRGWLRRVTHRHGSPGLPPGEVFLGTANVNITAGLTAAVGDRVDAAMVRITALENHLAAARADQEKMRRDLDATRERLEAADAALSRQHAEDVKDLAVGSLPGQTWGLLVTGVGVILAAWGDFLAP